ncbi:MAG: contractile injection system protein, VgrG/Pvc8 family [Alphaproteobacteria bacterium]|nr:contractile injection system protein, VgrG/Pvc8 family [Alphaproteobacteria bacterium]
MPDEAVLFYNALPRLEIDGAEDAMAAELLSSIEMTESEGGMSSIEICLENTAQIEERGNDMPFESSANDALTLGALIRVVAGDTNDPQEIFKGRITGLELVMEGATAPKLIVLAEDALQSARLKRRTRLHEQSTLDDLISTVAQEAGLQVVSSGLSMELLREVQANETDLGFLRRVCARFDVDFQIVGDELQVSERASVDRGSRALEFGDTLISFRGLADLADQVSAVTLSGWDHAADQPFSVTSGPGADAGAGEGRKGADFLTEHFDARSEHIAEIAVEGETEGQAVADAMLAARQRRFISVEGSVTGDPGLRVGTVVDITGVGARFENAYYVTHAQHRYDRASGYITDFRAESAFWKG